jgi:hypothetical protein
MDELFEFHHAIILILEPDNTTLKSSQAGATRIRQSGDAFRSEPA